MNFPAFRPGFTTRHLFFTGKGGVGKTSLSCATALAHAEMGERVLLISTDPASNLDEVLGVELASDPTPIPGVPGLHALNLDPPAAAAAYRERVLGPVRGLLPAPVLARMEEELSGACTVEIAAFDAFTEWMNRPDEEWERIIFDTAPTGHTLRLMGLAKAWDHFLSTNTTGNSCLGPLSGLEKQRELYEATVQSLADERSTTLVLVSRPETSALAEAARTSSELADLGNKNQQLVLNGSWPDDGSKDPAAIAMASRQSAALAGAAGFLESLPVSRVLLRAAPVLGLDGLRKIFDPVDAASAIPPPPGLPAFASAGTLIAELSASGRGVILTMGKGGVGKTTIATAIALELARAGHRVHLTTTDPANHLDHSLAGGYPNLTVGSIPPDLVTEEYRRAVLEEAGAGLDEEARALLEEDLRSPCTTEIAVFRAFAREVAKGEDGFVVLDTAPTGHTLLLLDASEAFHREAGRQSRMAHPEEVTRLLPRLRDPEFTRVLLVTLPEPTPVHEAAALQDDLRRAGIEPHAWVVNQSLQTIETNHPILSGRRAAEVPCLREVAGKQTRAAVVVPWVFSSPRTVADFHSLILSSPAETPATVSLP